MRTTRKQVETAFSRTAKIAGWDVEGSYFDAITKRPRVGYTFLCEASSGWYIARITNEGGGEKNLCEDYYTLHEMLIFLNGVAVAMKGVK